MIEWAEMKTDIIQAEKGILDGLAKIYQPGEGEGEFFSRKGVLFSVTRLDRWNCFVIDYSDTMEDGDRFYPEDFDSLESLLKKMTEEIDKDGRR